ncbi:hypothetical protein [Bifidobacterium pullorum]|uniref:hypothetical protein n=1 Tax=Bifidobacterium pullorum TaxID=78448 RepID=UPI00052978B9|nr:hypothetical protein [Bifidobacterium pullorum]
MNGLAPIPPLVSVTEAAATLGVTRQRVLQMIHEGTVNGWALSHAEIDNLAAKKYAINSSH